MMNLTTLLAQPIAGNAFDDSGLMLLIDDFVACTSNPMHERLIALHFLDKVMGVECPMPDVVELEEYLAEAA